ncbi:MAG: sigma-70 family RNA polymerase sigma factor [Verrucomicrobiota bacterium]
MNPFPPESADPSQDSPCKSDSLPQEQFTLLLFQAEVELRRYVMGFVPNSEDARDIVQETMVALWRSMDKYDCSRPFVPWACRFALNEVRRFLRSEFKRRRLLAPDVVDMLETRREITAGSLEVRSSFLQDCLGLVPEDLRGLIRDYYFHRVGVDAIAARMNKRAEAVYKSLQRVRQALYQCIEKKVGASI